MWTPAAREPLTLRQPQHKLRALKAGARDFVSKPFDLAELVMRVHNMLEVRLLHRETRTLYDQIVEQQKLSENLWKSVDELELLGSASA